MSRNIIFALMYHRHKLLDPNYIVIVIYSLLCEPGVWMCTHELHLHLYLLRHAYLITYAVKFLAQFNINSNHLLLF
jgi:hypothetical protein